MKYDSYVTLSVSFVCISTPLAIIGVAIVLKLVQFLKLSRVDDSLPSESNTNHYHIALSL